MRPLKVFFRRRQIRCSGWIRSFLRYGEKTSLEWMDRFGPPHYNGGLSGSEDDEQLVCWPPATSYMRSEVLARTGVLGWKANLHLSPGETKPGSEGMFWSIESFCGARRNPDVQTIVKEWLAPMSSAYPCSPLSHRSLCSTPTPWVHSVQNIRFWSLKIWVH